MVPIIPWKRGERIALRELFESDRQGIVPLIEIFSILSEGLTLQPGDMIATGTPEGVGVAMSPPGFLEAGDVVECEIEKIGVLRNRVAAPT